MNILGIIPMPMPMPIATDGITGDVDVMDIHKFALSLVLVCMILAVISVAVLAIKKRRYIKDFGFVSFMKDMVTDSFVFMSSVAIICLISFIYAVFGIFCLL